ncbi:hypothetical protein B296_00056187 [Ensete ventricosum]|uniref:Uncharacterized protein n=1 Tax=Ensete ventricosum TaxID=4639 RepID=A0A426X6R4_ENSVE|nr:hypothetical protein B296_00056187 [Ensete ventricosum]
MSRAVNTCKETFNGERVGQKQKKGCKRGGELNQYQEESSGYGINVVLGNPGRSKEEVDDQSTDDRSHQGGADEEGIPSLQSCVRRELEYEVVVYSGASPREYVAAIQEYVQAKERKHAAARDHVLS